MKKLSLQLKTFFRTIWQAYLAPAFAMDGGDPTVLDHVETPRKKPRAVNMAAIKLARARAEAGERHGKQFVCDTLVSRHSEPSLLLKEILKKSPKPASETVTDIRKGAKR